MAIKIIYPARVNAVISKPRIKLHLNSWPRLAKTGSDAARFASGIGQE
jgi:hypothetical protein